MLNIIYSILSGAIVGVIYSFLFLASFNLGSSGATKFDFQQVLTFVARFIFIIVVAVALPIYFNVDLLWFLLSLGVTFWGFLLTKLRIR